MKVNKLYFAISKNNSNKLCLMLGDDFSGINIGEVRNNGTYKEVEEFVIDKKIAIKIVRFLDERLSDDDYRIDN